MSLPRLALDHLNLPSRDPEKLARWYGETFGLKVDAGTAMGPGITLFFTKGEPLARGQAFHFGFRVANRDDVRMWSERLKRPIAFDEADFFAVRVEDPEGNLFEIYWEG